MGDKSPKDNDRKKKQDAAKNQSKSGGQSKAQPAAAPFKKKGK